ncbi:MAG TPA: drug/metabolite exporter YedA [Longimicrobiales bacterium]|nr:drug/metabolite exporter YedA [Longimicrobiales bacterium]
MRSPAGDDIPHTDPGSAAANAADTPPIRLVIAAFAAVYIVWGSTYLAIRFAIETLPPLLMAGVRFLVAGSFLYGWARWRGAGKPRLEHWRAAAVIGALLLLGGNGAVTWAEQFIPSGIAALLIAVVPCWMVLIDWVRPGGPPPTAQIVAGLVLGLVGVAILIGPESLMGGDRINLTGAAVVLGGSMSWAAGSILSRHVKVPSRPLLATGIQMLCGGALLILAGLVSGEAAKIDASAISAKSVLALIYLILIGAIVGYSAYIWLLRVSTPARVSTYAYVNPVVAVLLGWLFAGETVSPRVIAAAAVIVAGVALITLSRVNR